MDFYKFEKHETGWRFLANLDNKNRFASRKKLSRKQFKTYMNSFPSIYQVNDDIIKIEKKIKISDFMVTFPSTWLNFKTEVLKKLQNFSKKAIHLAKVSETHYTLSNSWITVMRKSFDRRTLDQEIMYWTFSFRPKCVQYWFDWDWNSIIIH